MSQLSVIILCGQSPRHLYFCQPIYANLQAAGHNPGGRARRPAKKNNQAAAKNPANYGAKSGAGCGIANVTAAIKKPRFFFADQPPQLDRNDLRVEAPHINHPDVIKLIDECQPDLIAVFGTSLLKGELLEKGRLGIINLHGGLSPEYRGADCTFWALHNREPEKVGCTLHYINAGIDTGNIIAHVSPEIKSNRR